MSDVGTRIPLRFVDVDLTEYGFGGYGPPVEATVELEPGERIVGVTDAPGVKGGMIPHLALVARVWIARAA